MTCSNESLPVLALTDASTYVSTRLSISTNLHSIYVYSILSIDYTAEISTMNCLSLPKVNKHSMGKHLEERGKHNWASFAPPLPA